MNNPIVAASAVPIGPLLTDLVFVFGVATLLVALLQLKRLPSLLGFLLTGILVGPVGFGLVSDAEELTLLAEFGVVLLMFTIGVEVSLKDLLRMGRQVLGGGVLQMGLTFAVFMGLYIALGAAVSVATAMGLLIAASSTALVLRLLGDRGELGTPYGQLSLSILLFQDFAVVGLMLLLPMLAGEGFSTMDLLVSIGQAILVTVGIFVAARVVMPWVFRHIVELRSREVFLLATVAGVFASAWIAAELGLSLALGAFVAGLVVSESEYSHQMFAEILPFRDIFIGLFFVSVGLLIRPEVVWGQPGTVAALIGAAIILKFAIVFGVGKVLGLSNRNAFLAGVALAQLGEFGLVLAQQAALLEMISSEEHSVFIAAAVVTMALTPIAVPLAKKWVETGEKPVDKHEPSTHGFNLHNHVVVVGYGLNGRNVARALRRLGVPYVVVEMNRQTVQQESEQGVPIVFGNATRPALLQHLNILDARVLVSAIADAAATREIVANAHHANPDLLIVARTRYLAELEPLRELGADVVVPEELETSIELVARVMKAYGASEPAVSRERRTLRDERYRLLLEDVEDVQTETISELLSGVEVERLVVPDESPAVGKTLGELDLRARTGATVVAVLRGSEALTTPDASFRLRGGDTLVVAGDVESTSHAAVELRLTPESS
jgi:CPA2 family monovalent cation:H+ antiporter-2